MTEVTPALVVRTFLDDDPNHVILQQDTVPDLQKTLIASQLDINSTVGKKSQNSDWEGRCESDGLIEVDRDVLCLARAPAEFPYKVSPGLQPMFHLSILRL